MNASPDRVAIITGASRGIGSAVAERLAKDGFAVVINYSGDAQQAEERVASIKQTGGRALAVRADVSDAAAVARMFDVTQGTFGGVDVLVNNAGVMSLANLADVDDATFDRVLAINLKGTFNTLRLGAKRLRSGGRIINFSSSVVGLLMPSYSIYAATKSAVETLTRILARELRGRNITVNAVAPGPTATDLFIQGKSQEVIERFAKQPPLERLGQPQDIAGVVSFLAGPDGGWINGQVLRANGGII